MSTLKHPNKHIRAAIEYAVARGWRVEKAPARSHAWGYILCPYGQRGGCRKSVWSTPRVPERHARELIRLVDACPHVADGGRTED